MATLLRTLRFAAPRAATLPRVSPSATTLNKYQFNRTPNISLFSTLSEGAKWAELPEAEREAALLKKLQKELDAKDINIIDLSGGCGTMYRIELTSPKFKGKGMLAQHRMVNEILADEIKNMHGLTLKTVAE